MLGKRLSYRLLPLCACMVLVAQASETVLYTFTGGRDGDYLQSGVVGDQEGNLYGTTIYGGAYERGNIYELSADGSFSVRYNFMGTSDGEQPNGLLIDSAGNLYGTTRQGATPGCYGSGCGVIFELDTSGTYTVLYTFTGLSDGGIPSGPLARDSLGNLYGTAAWGGTGNSGVLFELSATGQYSVLYNFSELSGLSNPLRDRHGNLYGVAYRNGSAGNGVVYKVDQSGVQTILHTFSGGLDGGYPSGGLIRDSAGNIYGTATLGGSARAGLIFKVDAAGNYTVLYNFKGGRFGRLPSGSLTRDAAGNIYGTTAKGGSHNWGLIYKVDAAGNYTVLHRFTGLDGSEPLGSLLLAKRNLYGTTYNGGRDGAGVLFQAKP
jgi:uncharacterized repeat protein (TIGR03803 family)